MMRAATILLLLLLPGAGFADDPPDPAQANEVGKVLFAEGDFDSARVLWEAAFHGARGSDELALATNLGITCFRLQRWADAFYYFSFARAHEDLGHERIKKHKKVTQALQFLRKKLTPGHGRLIVRTRPSPNAEVCVGELEPVCRKAPLDWHLDPGLHELRVGLAGAMPLTETVRIRKGETTRLDLLLPGAAALHDYRDLSLGGHHACLISRDGDLRCFGDNRRGQLGVDRGDWYHQHPLLVDSLGLPVRAVAAGAEHTCALTGAGTVFCWGEGSRGRLGNGTIERPPSWAPVPVVGLPSDGKALAVGRDHACVVVRTGAVHCWGANDHGQLGNDGPKLPSPVALPVPGLEGVIDITAGYGFTCVLQEGGAIRCWGRSPAGASSTPTLVEGAPAEATAIAAGDRHLAILAGVQVWIADAKPPRRIAALAGARQIAAAADRTCALWRDGAIRCARGKSSERMEIYRPGDSPAVAFAAASTHLCAVLEDGRFRCIGEDELGQLGR
jgi:hypothetical protein